MIDGEIMMIMIVNDPDDDGYTRKESQRCANTIALGFDTTTRRRSMTQEPAQSFEAMNHPSIRHPITAACAYNESTDG